MVQEWPQGWLDVPYPRRAGNPAHGGGLMPPCACDNGAGELAGGLPPVVADVASAAVRSVSSKSAGWLPPRKARSWLP